jgi:glucose-6-phosphate 1-epimerase
MRRSGASTILIAALALPHLCNHAVAAAKDARPDARAVEPSSEAGTGGPAALPPSTKFTLPTAYPQLLQTPSPTTREALKKMREVPGLSVGTFQGLDALLVETPLAKAAVSLFGGQVVSFAPAGQEDVFWLSPLRAALPTPIRGGTPVCWPWFGRQGQTGEVPAHGLARTLPWRLVDARREADGTVVLELQPPPLQDLALELRMQLRIGRTLEQRLVTRNTGREAVVFTEALHNYFHVSDAAQVRIEGLAGRPFHDKNDHGNRHVQHGDWHLLDPRDPGRADFMFPAAGGSYRLVDPGLRRRIELEVRDGRTAIVWNPGEAGAAKMADIGPHWRRFVCLEAANAGPDVVELAPGATHALVPSISVVRLD